jgi:HSP20 family protein
MDEKLTKTSEKSKDESKSVTRAGWDRMLNLRDEIDHLFEEFSDNWPFGFPGRSKTSAMATPFVFGGALPAVDVCDKDDRIEVKAELPGMDEKDIDVELTDRMLVISGEKKEEHEEGQKEGNYYVSERRYGSFKRSIAVPDGIDKDKVDASFKKGVLTVVLKKTPESREKAKKIKVKASA